jgi:hypothetical protein
MQFMLMGLETRGEWEKLPQTEQQRRIERHQQALQELIAQRGLTGGGSLVLTSVALDQSSAAITLRTDRGKRLRIDGPFAETKEVLAGFDLIDFASRDQAVAFAKRRCTHDGHVTEVRPVHESWWAHHGPGLGSAMRFMLVIVTDVQQLARRSAADIEGTVAHHERIGMEYNAQKGLVRDEPLYFCSARLRPNHEASTLRIRGGDTLISDGPFAETKEAVGGFMIIDCAGQDEAVEWAEKLAGGTETIEVRRVRSMWSVYHA